MKQVNVYYLLRKPGKYFGSYEHIAALMALTQKDYVNMVYTRDAEEFATILNGAMKRVLTSTGLFEYRSKIKSHGTRIKEFSVETEIRDNLFMGKELEEQVMDSKKLLIVLPYTGWSIENFLDTLDRMPVTETLDVDEINIITTVQLSKNLSKSVFRGKCKAIISQFSKMRRVVGFWNFTISNFIMDKNNVAAKDVTGSNEEYVSMDVVQMMTLIRRSAERGTEYEKLCHDIFFDDILRKESLTRAESISATNQPQVDIPNFTDRDLKITGCHKDRKGGRK